MFKGLIIATSASAGVALVAAAAWTPQLTGVNARLRGVSAVSDKIAWASGTAGTVLRTTDGGDNWKQVSVPNAGKLDFRDIDALSDKVAYVLSIGNGELSRIFKTTDGGASWTPLLVNSDPKVFLDAMAFWSADRGIAYSDSIDGQFVIYRTTDGRTWNRIPAGALPPALPNEGAYAASGTNVASARQERRVDRNDRLASPALERWREHVVHRPDADRHQRRRRYLLSGVPRPASRHRRRW